MKKRRPITDAMKLAVLRRVKALVPCPVCLVHAHKMFSGAALWDDYMHPLTVVEFDHHLALVDGGKHTAENLRPLCPAHHKEKSAREHIANCKAKRLKAGPKKSKNPMPKTHQKLQAHVDGWGKAYRAKLEANRG